MEVEVEHEENAQKCASEYAMSIEPWYEPKISI